MAEEGGLFVWVGEAFGSRLGWLAVFLPNLLYPIFSHDDAIYSSHRFWFSEAIASNTVLLIGSIIVFGLLHISTLEELSLPGKLLTILLFWDFPSGSHHNGTSNLLAGIREPNGNRLFSV